MEKPKTAFDLEELKLDCYVHPDQHLDFEIRKDGTVRVEPCEKCIADAHNEGELYADSERRSREERQQQWNEANNWVLQLSMNCR